MNIKKITSFTVDWYDCGCSCIYDILHEQIKVYSKGVIIIKKYNGQDEIIDNNEILVKPELLQKLFDNLTAAKFESDYRAGACDGSMWKLALRHSDNTIKLVNGTDEIPKMCRIIQKTTRAVLIKSNCSDDPKIFGC